MLLVATLSSTWAAEQDSLGPVFKQWEQNIFHKKYFTQNKKLEDFGLMQLYTGGGQEEGSKTTIREIQIHGEKKGWVDFVIEGSCAEGKNISDNLLAMGFLIRGLRAFPEKKLEGKEVDLGEIEIRNMLRSSLEKFINASSKEAQALTSGPEGFLNVSDVSLSVQGDHLTSHLLPKPSQDKSCCQKYNNVLWAVACIVSGVGGGLIAHYGF